MNSDQVLLLFPGQGGYAPGSVEQAARRDPGLFEAIRSTGIAELGIDVAELRDDERPLRELAFQAPKHVHLAIYLSAVVAGRTALKRVTAPAALVGHSFGEIAALVVGGALTPAAGAQVVARRMAALDEHAPASGRMSVFVTGVERAEAIVRAVGESDLVLAGVNAAEHVVVSGPDEHLQLAEAAAKVLGVTTMRISSAYAFHNPQLAKAGSHFARALSGVTFDSPELPVFSPILGRFYAPDDDLANSLAQHLTTPFDLNEALGTLASGVATTFVECGAGTSLSAIVRGTKTEPWRAIPVDELATPALGDSDSETVASLLNLRAESSEFQEFWRASAGEVSGHLRAAYDAFRSQRTAAAPRPPVTQIPSDGGDVSGRLARLYADALEYPVEVFLEDPGVQLEADLGVDSVKQTDLLARAAAEFGLPVPEEGISVAEYPTFGSVVDLISTGATETAPDASASATAKPNLDPSAGSAGDEGEPVRDGGDVSGRLARLYADALEYPVEVFLEDPGVQLEADLGVDSVKQTDLLARAAAEFGLPVPEEGISVAEYPTFGSVVDLISTGATEDLVSR